MAALVNARECVALESASVATPSHAITNENSLIWKSLSLTVNITMLSYPKIRVIPPKITPLIHNSLDTEDE